MQLLETLSIDDGNGNGDGETEERLRRGRGCVAKLEAVKQAQYDDNFPRRGLNRMGAFHSPKLFDLNFRKFRSRMERAYSRSVSTFREQLFKKIVLHFRKSFPEKMLFHSIPTRNFQNFRRIESTHRVFVKRSQKSILIMK